MNITNADIKNLKDKKFKRDNGLFVVEGNKFCKDLLLSDIKNYGNSERLYFFGLQSHCR